MKRRRRYGEKYSGLPYSEEFKKRMVALFPNSEKLKEALDGGWDSVHKWFSELASCGSGMGAKRILGYVARGEKGIQEMVDSIGEDLERRQELKSLDDEWERIVYLDDQGCEPWSD